MSEQSDAVHGWRRPHGHTAVFGRGPASFAATAVATFTGARAGGDAMMLVSDDGDTALLDGLPDRDALLVTGRLRHLRTADAYVSADPAALFAAFDADLRALHRAGWSGVHIVADNTTAAGGDPEVLADWLAWEQRTSRWQFENPVVGVCWFDLDRIPADSVRALACAHPDVLGDVDLPFRIVTDAVGVRLVGEVTGRDVPLLAQLLDLAPHDGELVVDLTEAGYVHHTVFPALDLLAARVPRVRLVGAGEVLRRVYESVADPAGRVVLG